METYKINTNKVLINLATAFLMCSILTACGNDVDARMQYKAQILSAASLETNNISIIEDYVPILYQTLNNTNSATANIYIEGDGFAYINRSTPSKNPTPKTPVGLKLAVQDDNSNNVYYMARPCQYIEKNLFEKKCDQKYWTTHRFSSKIIDSVSHALNMIKMRDNVSEFNLIGFSGGANIAGLLAAQRNDIISIRSVAGNVDNDFFTQFHRVSDMPYSLNMANYSSQLASIPQIHYISESDKFVPYDIYDSYISKFSDKSCVEAQVIYGTIHLDGWDEKWPTLLSKIPTCR